MNARTEILARLRAARAAAAAPTGAPASPAPAPPAERPAGDLMDRLAERLRDYRAVVHRCPPDGLAATLARVLADSRLVVAPADLPAEWLRGHDGEVRREAVEEPLPWSLLDRAGTTVVTGCAAAIAETGTILLDSGRWQGRRELTLVPDHHVCVVFAAQVVRSVPDGLARLPDPTRPLTLISGPSATSDIELTRVEGVHGPRRLEVMIIESGRSKPGPVMVGG
ncbi:MAG TPA: LUD domain-containing protein [Natronosporangium sp.]|nr:LUD domain-containing protein [Natronosporangium sp.]